jgi:TM2 domain-containing membrane protein YozV
MSPLEYILIGLAIFCVIIAAVLYVIDWAIYYANTPDDFPNKLTNLTDMPSPQDERVECWSNFRDEEA